MILVNEEFPLSKDFKVDLDTLDGEYKADKRIVKVRESNDRGSGKGRSESCGSVCLSG